MHNAVFMTRWRTVAMPWGDQPGLAKVVAGIDATEEEIVKQQRAAAKPVMHKFRLVAL
jgi:hypothetical protein